MQLFVFGVSGDSFMKRSCLNPGTEYIFAFLFMSLMFSGSSRVGQHCTLSSDLEFGTGPHLLDDLDPKFQGGRACHDLLETVLKICHA